MTHLRPINQKAARIVQGVAEARRRAAAADGQTNGHEDGRVVALQDGPAGPAQPEGPHIPLGCSFVFSPGWEADRNGGAAGLCQPVERDLFDCHLGCFWPAQVPDQLNHAPDWTGKCAAAQKDWRKIDLIFP
jgi:hypothetical protein